MQPLFGQAMLDGLIIIGGSTVLAVGGLFVVRKKFKGETQKACHEVAGYLLAIIGSLYAILLGMIVVGSSAKVDQAAQKATVEANMLSNIAHMTQSFTPQFRQTILSCLYDYAVAAQGQDWSKVQDGQEKEATIPAYQRLWKEIAEFSPQGVKEVQAREHILSDMQELSDARRHRMIGARSTLSPVLWTVLIVGAVMIVLFTYFFFLENLLAQTVMTSFVVIFLSLNVYLVYLCQNPYRAEFAAKESGFGYSFTPNWFLDTEKSTDIKEAGK